MNDPDTTPNTIDILESDVPHAAALAEKLRAVPEVAHARTIDSFIPEEQDKKLELIDDANFFFQNTITPDEIHSPPTPAETLEAINKTAVDLSHAAERRRQPCRRSSASAGRVAHRPGKGSAARQGKSLSMS